MARIEPVERPVFPTVALFRLTPSEPFRKECADFDESSILHSCKVNQIDFQKLADRLAATGYFESIRLGDEELPYSLAIGSATYSSDSAEGVGRAALSGATLLLLPIAMDAVLKIEGLVRWRSQTIRRFSLELPYTARASVANLGEDFKAGLSDSIATNVVQQLLAGDVLSPAYLRETLQASDYDRDLRVPETIGGFVRQQSIALGSPLEGALVRFQYAGDTTGRVDVFVYPVDDWQYDQPAVLTSQVQSVREDMKLLAYEDVLRDLTLDEVEMKLLSAGNGQEMATFLAHYETEDGKALTSRTCVFTKEDKFVKVRATFDARAPALDEVESFTQALSEQISVPSESLFMARLRKQWRAAKL